MEDFPSIFTHTEPGGVINAHLMTLPTEGYGAITLASVLVRGGVEDVAVYQGVGTDDWVARHGRKLTYEEAILHFPALPRRWYRA